MRTILCATSLVLSAFNLVACGQTGPLVLPNDPNENRKTQYLIYKEDVKTNTTSQTSANQSTETSTDEEEVK